MATPAELEALAQKHPRGRHPDPEVTGCMVQAAWEPGLCGGCPKYGSWAKNPQFHLYPSRTSSVKLELQQTAGADGLLFGIGLIVIWAEDEVSPKTTVTKPEMVHFTKPYKAARVVSVTVQLEPRRGGLPYIVIPSTYEPNQLAQFRLLLSTDDPGCRFGWLGAATRVLDGSAALPPPLAASGSELLAAPHNEVVVKALGAALSKAQEKELERMVADATAWCLANDGKPYEDPEFPATNRSLWGGGANLTGLPDATAWLRPAQLPHSGAPAVLFRPELEQAHEEVSGVLKGSAALDDGWLLAACNIVAGRKEALERVFLHPPRAATSAAGAAAGSAMRGFYVVGFYVDDPHSDDDWRLVLVDDRLPCGADGALLFARCARAEAFWAPLLEKALAKLSGGYAKIGPRSVADGLELLTGGTPRELDLANVATLDELTRGAASRLPAAELGAAGRRVKLLRETTLLWDELRTGLEASPPQLVGCACESSGGSGERLQPSEAELAAVRASGLQTDRLVYTVVGAIEYGGKKLMRLRQLDGASEWNGAYSDGSAQWSANMRQMFNYANNGADGIFWMEYADFVGAFNKLHLVRMASDLYTQMYTRSRWHGASAGGAARFLSHRHNPQWLLEINKPTTLTLALSVDHAADRADAPAGQVGWAIYVGNARPADRRRRRLLASATDVVVAEAPRAARKVAATVTLLRSATPYVVVAHTDEPGYEAAFRLSILSDDREDDGLPDFKFTPVRASTDWKTSALRGAWAGASAPGSGEGYWANPQFELSVERQSRVFVFLEPDRLVDKAGEVRRQFPAAIGFELLKGERKFCKLHAQQPGQRLELAQASAGAEGVWLELPALAASGSEPYILVPFASALDGDGVAQSFTLSVYSDNQHSLAPIGKRPSCVVCDKMALVLIELEAHEAAVDERLAYLEVHAHLLEHKCKPCVCD